MRERACDVSISNIGNKVLMLFASNFAAVTLVLSGKGVCIYRRRSASVQNVGKMSIPLFAMERKWKTETYF